MENNPYANRTKYLDRKCYPLVTNVERKAVPVRVVPPFSIQSRQKNTIVQPFPKTPESAKKRHPVGKTEFKRQYLRGDIPVAMEFDNYGFKISWKTNLDEIDYNHFMPLFFDGLCEIEHPYSFFAQNGIHDLLLRGKGKILPVLPHLILPMKNALNTGHKTVVAAVLKAIQDLVMLAPETGEPLICFYRQILPPLNIYKYKYLEDVGDEVDYGQRRRDHVGDLVNETLEKLERAGGPNAFVNIKYIIPTYESVLYN